MLYKNKIFPKLISHKCHVSGTWIGNSPAALREAQNCNIEGIEIDLHFSKDTIPFLFHDSTLNDKTNGRGAIKELNAKALEGIVYKKTMVHYFLFMMHSISFAKAKTVFLDIKVFGLSLYRAAKKLVEIIDQNSLNEKVVI